ncbi:MAG: glycosyltransferase [Actinomycetota bacterium]|nr:glycosyltransferase [Actinomycetota bacterium]
MYEVLPIQALPLSRFQPLVGDAAAARLQRAAERAALAFRERSVWNVNSTASGGGVAEMLQPLVAYARGAGVDARWVVIEGDPEFFRITKRLHNGLHGQAGDGGPLGSAERAHYEEVLSANAEALRAVVRAGDVVLLHDPQTAGLVPAMVEAGALTFWRDHIGSDVTNDFVERSWSFLRPYVTEAAGLVFSRAAYVPEWLQGDPRVHIIAPSIDPFSTKNADMAPSTVRAVLAHVGVIQATGDLDVPAFARRDGSPGRVDHVADILRAGPAPLPDTPLVVQVSRWDRLKDMQGVMEGFAEHVVTGTDAQLALVGPNVTGVADDPEGAEVLDECVARWRTLPDAARARIQLVALPMADVEENAAIVNAVQRHAAVVVQKSLAEGFGLTVAEAMWKARPVVASAVGGIQDQIVHGEHGLLVQDPADLDEFGAHVRSLLADPALAEKLGQQARERTVELFLGNRHLIEYAALFSTLIET